MNKFTQKSIEHKVLQTIEKNGLIRSGEKIIIAVSGGADSVALLDILLKLKDVLNISIAVCHFNHRLRGEESDADAKFVKELCVKRKTECFLGRAPGKNKYKSEEEARAARYAFFEKILKEGRGDKVALAHNANDQVETFLLRLSRGSGIFGLKSIPLQRENFIRPLLPVTRLEIEKYLKDNGLQYKSDTTNISIEFDRNFIRHKVMPLFVKLNPKFVTSLLANISLIESDYNFLESLANEKLNEISIVSKESIVIDRKKWLQLPDPLKKLVLRLAINKLVGLKDITSLQLNEICQIIEKGVGKKHKILPHSLRAELDSGKIILSI